MRTRHALVLTLLVATCRQAEPRPPRNACTGGSWRVEWEAAGGGGGGLEVAIDPAHPRLSLGPAREDGATAVAFDPATCRVDVVVLTEVRHGAEGYEDEDNTLRLGFVTGSGRRAVTGEYERHVFDPRSDTTKRVKGFARRIKR